MELAINLPAQGYIRLNELLDAGFPMSRATIYRKVKLGSFPRPVRLSERVSAWRVCDIRTMLENAESKAGVAESAP